MRRALTLFALLPLAACMEPEAPSGALFFADNCASCHGMSGAGDGPFAEGLDPAPSDLTVLSARNGGIFPRDRVMSTIDGYRRGSHFSPDMPAFGEGDLGETVVVENPDGTGTPVPEVLLALADYIETLQD